MFDAFQEQDIFDCLKMCDIDKVPSLDGYPMRFYVKYWEILKQDTMRAFHNFHSPRMCESAIVQLT